MKTSATILHNGTSYSFMLYKMFRKVYMRFSDATKGREVGINELINLKLEYFKYQSFGEFQ